MKKSLTILTTAALAFSMLASVAMADNTKTAFDYKDLAGIDAGLKSKIDILLSNGIFEGVSGDSFGISQNMTRAQFAKVASLVFALPVDTTIRTSSFTDVAAGDPANGWAIPYIEAAKKAGLIDGMTDTSFAPGENVTVGQLDTVLLKGLGKTISVAAVPWYEDAVRQAASLSIHPTGKSGDVSATRADLAASAYASWQNSQHTKEQVYVSVSSAQASGDHTVQVALDNAVDTAKAALSLSKDGGIIPTDLTWSGDKKSATLTLSAGTKLTDGKYTVTLSGLDSSLIKTASASVTVDTSSASSAASGNYNYTVANSYDLGNVIDSGLTASASGQHGFVTKAQAEDPTISEFAKEIKIKITTRSGEEVAVPGIIQSVTSSNPTVVKTGVSLDHKGYILGNKAGSTTVNVIYSTLEGEIKQTSIPVNVKTDNVAGQLIEAKNTSLKQNVSVTNGVYAGSFNAYEKIDMKVTDNYGNEYEQYEIQKYNFALGTSLFAEDTAGDANKGAVGNVTIDSAGNVLITGNITRFTLISLLPNGKRVAADVQVVVN